MRSQSRTEDHEIEVHGENELTEEDRARDWWAAVEATAPAAPSRHSITKPDAADRIRAE